jgi:hypothetical protein
VNLCFAVCIALLQHREPLSITDKAPRLSGVEVKHRPGAKAFVPKSLRFFLAVSLVGVAFFAHAVFVMDIDRPAAGTVMSIAAMVFTTEETK